jgi:hypothetical protein
MAYWGNSLKHQVKSNIITLGDGENTFLSPFNLKRSESSYSRNLSSVYFPALSARKGRQYYSTAITTPNGMGIYINGYLHVLDGTTWKRWDGSAWQTVKASLTNARANFVEFRTESKKYIIMANGTDVYSWDGSSAATIAAAPATRLYTVDDYRLYALIGNVLKCSAEGSISDWTTALDADSITITGAKGTERAIITYNDNTICFFDNSMHVLYGNDPYDFYLQDPMEFGCVGDRALIEHNKKLYFLYDALYVYTGGTPRRISDKVKTCIDGIVSAYKSLCAMGSHGKYLYLSIPYLSGTTNNLTLEYDTELDLWYPHNVGYLAFVNFNNGLYGVDSTGQLWTINSGTDDNGTAISWEWISGVINHQVIQNKKIVSDYYLIIDLPVGSTLTMSYSPSIDGSDFTTLYTFTASATEQKIRVKLPTSALHGVDWYRIKFAGTGQCVVHGMEELLRIKTR